MNANDLTFGIELETIVPAGLLTAIGAHGRGVAVPGMPEGWIVERDISIHTENGYVAAEFVSPVLKGAEGVASVVAAVAWLNANGAKVNRSCGFHVHVGFSRGNKDGMKRLLGNVANHEKGFFAVTGTVAREQSRWCKPVRGSEEMKRVFKNGIGENYSYLDRYSLLNLSNLASGCKPTAEFRAFAGTLNIDKILGYVQLCVGFVQRSVTETCKRGFGRKYPASLNCGQAATLRMMKFLNWTSRKEVKYGVLDADRLDACRKAMVRMAAKYDAGSNG